MAKKPGFSGIPDRSVVWTRRDVDLTGKRALVVGGTNGLGQAIAREIANKGGRVTVVGRTFRDRGTAIDFVEADLSRMREAQRLGRELDAELDLVLMTSGIFAAPKREVTNEGLERDMAVSYLNRLAMLRELAPRLPKKKPRPRVFLMGFPGTGQAGSNLDDLNAERAYKSMDVHMNTVAGNEALVLDGATRYPDVGFFGLNPGLIKTGIRANALGEGSFKHRAVELLIGWFTMSPEKYGARTVPLLFAPELESRTAVMFNQKGVPILPTETLTPDRVAKLIDASAALVDRALGADGDRARAS
jgi:NAD(P)-dependent dehydrogenase (short-subunit alcohol dehydrogenase family)